MLDYNVLDVLNSEQMYLHAHIPLLYNTLFSREEIFAKREFEIFSREDVFANILFTRKYLLAKIIIFPRKYLQADFSVPQICRLVGLGYPVYYSIT